MSTEPQRTCPICGHEFFGALEAEALQLADRTVEALQITNEAEALVERLGEGLWRAEFYRLRGVLLAAMGADETETEASLSEAIRTAKEQKSIALAKRMEATYTEYHHQKVSAMRGRGFRIPLY
jgi:hypothetical protein